MLNLRCRAMPAVVLALSLCTGIYTAPAAAVEIRVLSNRADLLSGGDALVEILPADAGGLRVTLDGRDISGDFALRPNGRVMGLVTGLFDGPNLLRAGDAEIILTHHPIGGPIFSGEQVQPWVCTTERNGLGPALDEQCNAAPVTQWRYRNTAGAYADYDPANPPADVGTTTTDQGNTVPYIFRVETGAMNRGIYRYAILHDPAQPASPWERQPGWNGSVYYKFGASCGTSFSQGDPIESVEDNRALSQGYAVATASLSVLGSNCNTVTSAEALMMLKERIIEQYGPITHTRGKGGSGGSIGQTVVATGYPGLLQGLNVDLSFEDFWTTAVEVADCHLLLNYFTRTSPHLWANVLQQAAVTGHLSIGTCAIWEVSFVPLLDPTSGCGAGVENDYHPVSNPRGCRATVQDMQVNILGRRPPELWGEAEKAAGYGFANWPYDNSGRLYGLRALRAGDITPAQFLDLNQKIGTLDIDKNFIPGRREADPGSVEILYRAGLIASGESLKMVPIIDVRAAISNAEFHTNFHSYAMRKRLVNAQGHHDNQSIWQLLEVPNLPSVAGPEAFSEMGEWLRAIDADTSDLSIEEKIRNNRPEGAGDACIILDQKTDDLSRCALFTYFADPLIASGGPESNDIIKCTLAPLPVVWPADGSYGPLPFTPSIGPLMGEWDRLRALFPDGVCDYSRPGVDQVAVQPWTSFADGPGGVALPPPPKSAAIGTAASKRTETARYGGAGTPALLIGLAVVLLLRRRRM